MLPKTTCFCDLFAGFSGATLLSLRSQPDGSLVMRVETRPRVVGCPTCGSIAQSKGRSPVELIDLECFGRATRTIWVKRRFECVDADCPMGTWTEVDDEIAPSRSSMTTRAGRWVTAQVGRSARSVSEVATELGCDWHTVNDNVVAYGQALIDGDTARIGVVRALGLDEVLFAGSATTAASTSRRRSSTWRPASSWTSSLAAAASSLLSGLRRGVRRGDPRCASRPAISPAPIERCSRRRSLTPGSWPTPST